MAGRHCTICQRADRATIDALLNKPGVSLRAIVAQCAGASKDSLARHRAHLAPAEPARTGQGFPSTAVALGGLPADVPEIDTDSGAGVARVKRERRALWAKAERDILAQLTPAKLEKMNGRDLAVAGGIATDKFRKWADLERHEPVALAIPVALQQAFTVALQVNVTAGGKVDALTGPAMEGTAKPCP